MYAKIFESIYDGSLRKDWKALVTFQQFLVLCDEEGFVDKTAEAISARTTIPIDIIEHGIAELSAPDSDSRSQEEEGRRLVLINPVRKWGWRIVNYKAYRDIRSKEELRNYWKDQKREDRLAQARDRAVSLKNVLCAVYKRKENDNWNYMEVSVLAEVSRRENCVKEMDELLTFRNRRGKFFPQSIARLLENWTQTLDMARNGQSLQESPILQMKVVAEEIECHPANKESVRYDPKHTPAQLTNLKMLRQKYSILRSQVANG